MTSAETSTGQSGISPEIRVSVPAQTLDVISGNSVLASYPISTSKYGLGFEPGSYRTPTGRFRIAEMIGHGAQEWSVFKARVPTGEIAMPEGDEDAILTRILWLDGVDPGNRNTHERYIYIHGTNQESRIGTCASHGCIRMRNADIVDLFEKVQPGTPVEIVA